MVESQDIVKMQNAALQGKCEMTIVEKIAKR